MARQHQILADVYKRQAQPQLCRWRLASDGVSSVTSVMEEPREGIMPHFEVAHIQERGVDLIVIPLDNSFRLKSQADQDATIYELRIRASSRCV